MNYNKEEWLDFRNKYIDEGYSVIMSIGGHIVRIKDVIAAGVNEGVIVDDPFGISILLSSYPDFSEFGVENVTGRYKWGKVNNPYIYDNKGANVVYPFYGVGSIWLHNIKWILVGKKRIITQSVQKK